ncbi:MAG: hypothetical protein JNN13_19170 [Planctomycetes bacterium]|nr:hypothetical protein [Planctomycetota bacterium]
MQRAACCALLASLPAFGGCASVVRYSDALVGVRDGRTWFTRFPATLGATVGFVLAVPVDIAAWPATFVFYHSQPKESRDPLSIFLFPSFVLWKVGALVGAPFDAAEWLAWRSWQEPPAVTDQEREAIERAWDAREYSEYPVTPVYPKPPEPQD